jgi:PAS domain S-box-containing protein/putative nucleotidyltransferase with HDIG domain
MMREKRIMVVEDNRIIAASIKSTLESLDYRVPAVVSSGVDAVKKAEKDHFDLILMDIVLEGEIDGIEAASQIRSRFNIPVVFLTAYSDKKMLERAKITEPFGYIIKPFEEKELHSTIEIALYKHDMEKELRESRKWFSTTLNSIGDAVIATDKKGSITFMNSVAEALTGWKQKEALGKDLKDRIRLVLNDEAYSQKKNKGKASEKGRIIHYVDQAMLIDKGSKEIPVDYSDAPIRDEQGGVLGSVLVFRDVSERKQAQERLQRSFIKLRKTLDETVQSLASAVEMRDPYTAGHQERVANLACAIAKEMGVPDAQIEGIRMAGLIHDIGKIYVPAEILNKPSRLNEAEIMLIKKHPQVGYDILKGIEFPWPIAQIVLQHHERMLGTGYPQGLSGGDILLEARIIGVADVVEAMYSYRPYRPSMGVEKTLQEISKNRAILYDPVVVDACIKLFTEKGFKFEDEIEKMEEEFIPDSY